MFEKVQQAMTTLTASFNTIMEQMTKCLSEKLNPDENSSPSLFNHK